MKKIFSVIGIFILITSIVRGQDSDPGFKTYNLPPFTGIEAGDLANVIITGGNQQNVKAEKDAEGEANFEVKDGVLKIMPGSMTNLNNIKIFISCPDLNYIKTSGISKVSSTNTITSNMMHIKAMGASKVDISIIAQTLVTEISGAAKVTLKGFTNYHDLKMSGAANLSAKELEVEKMDVKGSGAAKANINVKNELNGELSGVSSIKYDQKPAKIGHLLSADIEYDEKNTMDSSVNRIYKYRKFNNAEDTVNVSIWGKEIKVVEGEDTKISIGNTEIIANDKGVKINRGNKDKVYVHKFKGHWAGFELGFNGYVNNNFGTSIPAFTNESPSKYEFLELNDVKSVGVNLNLFELNGNIINNRFGVVSGIGLQWNNYRFDDNVVLLPDSGVIYGYHNTNINSYIKSKLVESWVRVPLFLEYQTAKRKGKQFHIAAGGVFGYKLGSHSKQVHFEGGDRTKDKVYSDFYLNSIKLDAEVRIGWGPINLFASYALTPLFKDGKGPELYPYMVGITLAGW